MRSVILPTHYNHYLKKAGFIMSKRNILSFLVITFLFSTIVPIFACADASQPSSSPIQEILTDYHLEAHRLKTTQATSATNRSSYTDSSLKKATISKLESSGYEAYDVTPSSYASIEEALDTDFETIGLNPSCSYIIAIGDGYSETAQSGSSPRYDPDTSSFTYTVNGQTYTMRYLTVTASDDPRYGRTETYSVLNSSGRSFIVNCLNTAISAYLDQIWEPLGIVASICGLDIDDFNTAHTATLYMHGGTNWTRVYTQVWNPNEGTWMYGSCVEYVMAVTSMSGQYYSATANRYLAVPTDESWKVSFSSKYSDEEWKKSQAVAGYLQYWTQYDIVGDVEYKYGNKVVITHPENF